MAVNSFQPSRRSGKWLRRVLWLIVAAIFILALTFCWQSWKAFKRDLTSYEGVTIGQSKFEVQYALGAPQTVDGPDVKDPSGWTISTPLRVNPLEHNEAIPADYEPIPADKTTMDYDGWNFVGKQKQVSVSFDKKTGRVKSISCWADRQTVVYCDPIFDIDTNTNEDDVLREVGIPSEQEISGGGKIMGQPVAVTKTMNYKVIGLSLLLDKRTVYSVTKHAPGHAGFGWWVRNRLL